MSEKTPCRYCTGLSAHSWECPTVEIESLKGKGHDLEAELEERRHAFLVGVTITAISAFCMGLSVGFLLWH